MYTHAGGTAADRVPAGRPAGGEGGAPAAVRDDAPARAAGWGARGCDNTAVKCAQQHRHAHPTGLVNLGSLLYLVSWARQLWLADGRRALSATLLTVSGEVMLCCCCSTRLEGMLIGFCCVAAAGKPPKPPKSMFKRMFSRKKKEGDAAKEDDSESSHGFSFLKKSKCGSGSCACARSDHLHHRVFCHIVQSPESVLLLEAHVANNDKCQAVLVLVHEVVRRRSLFEWHIWRGHCSHPGAPKRRRWPPSRRRQRRRQLQRTPSSWCGISDLLPRRP